LRRRDVRDAVLRGLGDLLSYVERVSDATPERTAGFFAKGMLLSVIASLRLENEEPMATRLLAA
jgi:hypothetical protein